jgi:hypothetical protein
LRCRSVFSACGLGTSTQRQSVLKIPCHAWQLTDAIGHVGDNARCSHSRYTPKGTKRRELASVAEL